MPTTTIGAAYFEDVTLNSSGPDANNGARTFVACGRYGTLLYRGAFRIASNQIPAGTIVAARLLVYRYASAGESVAGGTLQAYRIADANTWVEGTGVAAVQTGSCCWNYARYNMQVWAGSVGCGTSGTDYYADASPPAVSYPAYQSGADVLLSFSLPVSWFIAWRSGATNNGWILREATESVSGSLIYLRSSEAASNRPYIEIDTLYPSYYRRHVLGVE